MSTDVIGYPLQTVGSGGSSSAFLEGWPTGQRIQKIEAWTQDSNRIRGIKLYLWGESSGHLYGSASGTYSSYTFQEGETITTMTLWAGSWNGNQGSRAGYITFTTSKNGTFNTSGGGKSGSAVTVNVYSGILVGGQFWYGDDVNVMGFAFLRPIVSCTTQDVTYPTTLPGAINVDTLDSYNNQNNGTESVNWSLDSSKDYQVSSTWSNQTAFTVGMSVSVTAKVPFVAEVDTGFEWGLSDTVTASSTTTTTRTLSWSVNGTVPTGQAIDVQVTAGSGSISIPYSGNVNIVVQTGETSTANFIFPVTGQYDGVSVSQVKMTAN